MGKGPTRKRTFEGEFLTSFEAIETASNIAGYKVNPATIQQAVREGRIFGSSIAHVLVVQKRSLVKYAERLRDGESMNFKREAATLVADINSRHQTVRKLVKEGIR